MCTNGNIFRLLIGTIILVVYLLYAQSWMAPLVTDVVNWAGIETTGLVTGGGASNIFAVIIGFIGKLLGKW